jgi:hypothetical protein
MNQQTGVDYERSDIDPATIGWIAAGLAAFVLAVPLLMPLVFPQSMHYASPAGRPALRADAPALEVVPAAELRRLRRGNADFADTYGWTDRSRNIVRIPVARAVELLLQRGLPGWPSS